MPPAVRRLASIAAVLLGALALAVPAFAANAGLTPVDPKSPNAQAINDTYWLLVGSPGSCSSSSRRMIAFHRPLPPGAQVDAEGPQIHGNTRLEVSWTVVPVLLVAVIVGFVFYKLPEISAFSEDASAAPDDVELRIDVAGRQFYWEFRYPDGSVTYDTLVVPSTAPSSST